VLDLTQLSKIWRVSNLREISAVGILDTILVLILNLFFIHKKDIFINFSVIPSLKFPVVDFFFLTDKEKDHIPEQERVFFVTYWSCRFT